MGCFPQERYYTIDRHDAETSLPQETGEEEASSRDMDE